MRRLPLALVLACTPLVLVACSDGAPPPAGLRSMTASQALADRKESAAPLATLVWQEQARSLVTSHNTISPIVAGRIYGLLGIAQYGAVVNAHGRGNEADTEPWSHAWRSQGRGGDHPEERGAVAGASAQVLAYVFAGVSDAAAVKQALEARVAAQQAAAGRDAERFAEGVRMGRAFGDLMVARGKADGFTTPPPATTFPPCSGCWTPATGVAPAGLQFPRMKPYFLESPAQFHSPPPPAFRSAEYNAALAEIRGYSDLPSTDPVRIAQLDMAVRLNGPAGTPTALGYWGEMAAERIAADDLAERDAAYVMALMNAAASDAVIGCWESKYSYNYIRPSQADPLIKLPIGLPNHPSYPSGHSCVSGAAATVLTAFFPEHADEFHQRMIDNGDSRKYAGIHYQFDVEAGQTLGRSVAEWALQYDKTKGLLAAVR